jgi:hypothetical protein
MEAESTKQRVDWLGLLLAVRRGETVGPEADKAVSGMTALPSGGLDFSAPRPTATG